jgi:tetratricopeptide (TPR) repeat protein
MEKQELLEALAIALTDKQQLELQLLSKEAVTDYPEEAFGYAYLSEAMTLEVPARLPQAEVALAKAAEIEPENIAYLIRFAEIKDRQGKFEDAQIIWTKILLQQPTYTPALLAIAHYQLKSYQDYPEALRLLSQAIELDGTNQEQYLLRAEAQIGLENHEAALEDIEKVLANGFEYIATTLKIDALKALGRIEEAFPLYESILQHKPEDYIMALTYGQDLLSVKRLDEAIAKIELGIQLQEAPQASHYYLLGETALEAKQLDKAMDALEQSIRIDTTNLEPYTLLIEAKINQKDFEGAIDTADQLLQLAGNDESLIERASIQKGIALIYLNKLTEAEEILTPIAKKEGLRQKEGYYGLGMVYKAKGDDARAYRFMKAAKLSNYSPAEDFIRMELQDYTAQLQAETLQQNAAGIKKNAASAVLQKMIGKLWKFDHMESEQLKEMPADFKQRLENKMQNISLLLTEKGVLMVSDDDGERLTYTLKKEGNNAVIVDFVPLDKFPPYAVKLKLSDKGLAFNKEKNEIMHFVAQDPATAPSKLIQNYQNHIKKEEIAYLGTAADTVLGQLL